LQSLAAVAGELLARGHARSGDALMIKGYIGAPEKVLKSIVRYGLEYAALTQADFESFQKLDRGHS
jgi:thiamine monophosphate kinase